MLVAYVEGHQFKVMLHDERSLRTALEVTLRRRETKRKGAGLLALGDNSDADLNTMIARSMCDIPNIFGRSGESRFRELHRALLQNRRGRSEGTHQSTQLLLCDAAADNGTGSAPSSLAPQRQRLVPPRHHCGTPAPAHDTSPAPTTTPSPHTHHPRTRSSISALVAVLAEDAGASGLAAVDVALASLDAAAAAEVVCGEGDARAAVARDEKVRRAVALDAFDDEAEALAVAAASPCAALLAELASQAPPDVDAACERRAVARQRRTVAALQTGGRAGDSGRSKASYVRYFCRLAAPPPPPPQERAARSSQETRSSSGQRCATLLHAACGLHSALEPPRVVLRLCTFFCEAAVLAAALAAQPPPPPPPPPAEGGTGRRACTAAAAMFLFLQANCIGKAALRQLLSRTYLSWLLFAAARTAPIDPKAAAQRLGVAAARRACLRGLMRRHLSALYMHALGRQAAAAAAAARAHTSRRANRGEAADGCLALGLRGELDLSPPGELQGDDADAAAVALLGGGGGGGGVSSSEELLRELHAWEAAGVEGGGGRGQHPPSLTTQRWPDSMPSLSAMDPKVAAWRAHTFKLNAARKTAYEEKEAVALDVLIELKNKQLVGEARREVEKRVLVARRIACRTQHEVHVEEAQKQRIIYSVKTDRAEFFRMLTARRKEEAIIAADQARRKKLRDRRAHGLMPLQPLKRTPRAAVAGS